MEINFIAYQPYIKYNNNDNQINLYTTETLEDWDFSSDEYESDSNDENSTDLYTLPLQM